MGGIVKGLFGGSSNSSTQQSSSSNRAFDLLKDPLSGMVGQGANAFNNLSDALGGGFDAFKKNSGYDATLNRGIRDRVGGAAAKGLLNSGAAAKGIARYETDLGNQTYGNWLDRLGSVSQLGLGAAGALGGTGGVSTSTGTSKGSSNNGILGGLFG